MKDKHGFFMCAKDDNGALTMEWCKKGSRFGITFEKDRKDSGWFYVHIKHDVMKSGSLENQQELIKAFEEFENN